MITKYCHKNCCQCFCLYTLLMPNKIMMLQVKINSSQIWFETEPYLQWRSQPSLSGGVKWKNLPDFSSFSRFLPLFPIFPHVFPDFPLFFLIFPIFPIFPDFFLIFQIFPSFFRFFAIFFAVKGSTLPPCPITGFVTAYRRGLHYYSQSEVGSGEIRYTVYFLTKRNVRRNNLCARVI